MDKKKILVIAGGFGGVFAARQLRQLHQSATGP